MDWMDKSIVLFFIFGIFAGMLFSMFFSIFYIVPLAKESTCISVGFEWDKEKGECKPESEPRFFRLIINNEVQYELEIQKNIDFAGLCEHFKGEYVGDNYMADCWIETEPKQQPQSENNPNAIVWTTPIHEVKQQPQSDKNFYTFDKEDRPPYFPLAEKTCFIRRWSDGREELICDSDFSQGHWEYIETYCPSTYYDKQNDVNAIIGACVPEHYIWAKEAS